MIYPCMLYMLYITHQKRFKHLKKEKRKNERETRTWLDTHTSTSNNPHDHIILTFPVSFLVLFFLFPLLFCFFLDLGFEG